MALLKDHLIAHYKMNDNLATDVIIDETGSHNGAVKDATGTATSAFHSVAGKIVRAQDLDGTDDYIEITDHADFSPGNAVAGSGTPFSISTWVYMHNATTFTIASKGVYNTDGEWRLGTAASKISLRFFDESVASCYIGRRYNTVLTAYENTWLHIVGTYDGGTVNSCIKLYLNAIQVDDTDNAVNAASFVAVENLTHAIWIGNYAGTLTNGLVDNIMFFNKELTLGDVKALYNNGAGTENIPIGIQLSRTGQRFSSFPEN